MRKPAFCTCDNKNADQLLFVIFHSLPLSLSVFFFLLFCLLLFVCLFVCLEEDQEGEEEESQS